MTMASVTAPISALSAIPPSPMRDARIDNARFVLITLVVLGHAIQPLLDIRGMSVTYSWIYLFHMPAFVFLTGLVLKSVAVNTHDAQRLVTGLLIPFLIFEVIYRTVDWRVDGEVNSLIVPSWSMWFLPALIAWRLSAPLLGALRQPVVITLLAAILFSSAEQLPGAFTVGRIIMLLPFFAAGLMLRPSHLERLATPKARAGAVLVLAISIPFAVLVSRELSVGYVRWTGRGGRTGLDAIIATSSVYVAAAFMIAAVLALTPARRTWMTRRGQRSLHVYVLHILPILAFRDWARDADLAAPWLVLLATGYAIALSVVLSSNLVARITRPLVQPRMPWLFSAPRA